VVRLAVSDHDQVLAAQTAGLPAGKGRAQNDVRGRRFLVAAPIELDYVFEGVLVARRCAKAVSKRRSK